MNPTQISECQELPVSTCQKWSPRSPQWKGYPLYRNQKGLISWNTQGDPRVDPCDFWLRKQHFIAIYSLFKYSITLVNRGEKASNIFPRIHPEGNYYPIVTEFVFLKMFFIYRARRTLCWARHDIGQVIAIAQRRSGFDDIKIIV